MSHQQPVKRSISQEMYLGIMRHMTTDGLLWNEKDAALSHQSKLDRQETAIRAIFAKSLQKPVDNR